MNTSKKLYTYTGPLIDNAETLFTNWTDSVWAKSPAQAKNYILYHVRQFLGQGYYDIDESRIKEISKEKNLKAAISKYCDKCGAQLTDGGYCPKCDDGEDDV